MAVEISSWADLQSINSNLAGDFILMNNLDSSSPGYDIYASSSANSGNGWLSIGNLATPFTGIFNGDGFTISDIFIDRSGTDYQGLFGILSGATVSNIGVINCDITGGQYVGGITGDNGVSSSLSQCYSTGTVIGIGLEYTGGLTGRVQTSIVINCYSMANVTGVSRVGGLIGRSRSSSTVSNSYSTGSVIATGTEYGGFLGKTSTVAVDCFWDTETSGQANSVSGIGKTTSEMQTQSTFINWDFDTIWEINSGEYPNLQIFNKDAESSITEISKVKVAGTFSSKPVMVKIGGTFVEKIMKVRVGGTFQ